MTLKGIGHKDRGCLKYYSYNSHNYYLIEIISTFLVAHSCVTKKLHRLDDFHIIERIEIDVKIFLPFVSYYYYYFYKHENSKSRLKCCAVVL